MITLDEAKKLYLEVKNLESEEGRRIAEHINYKIMEAIKKGEKSVTDPHSGMKMESPPNHTLVTIAYNYIEGQRFKVNYEQRENEWIVSGWAD